MDTLNKYRNIIREELEKYTNIGRVNNANNQVEDQVIFDSEHDRYQAIAIGWAKARRVYFPIFQLDIINGKIWVQHNVSDYDIVGELEKRGVPKSDIVLAFHAPSMRKYTEYADT